VLDARHDPVAMNGLIQIAAGDEDVAADPFGRAVWDDEPETPGVRLHAAHDQVHAVGQTVAAAPRLNQRAGGHQLLQQPRDGRPIFSRNPEALEELPDGGGMIHLVANQGQQLVAIQHG
jgi:hypothetical protein